MLKKILLTTFVSLLVSFNVQAAKYIFKKDLWTNCNILSKKDQSTLKNIDYKEEKKVKGWDRRKATADGWSENFFTAFIFFSTFENGQIITIRVNTEFKNKLEAKKQAMKYGTIYGQLPNFLRSNLNTITIHKGKRSWGGGNNDILIHTQAKDYSNKKVGDCVEEIMIHESAHVSLDWSWGGSLKKKPWMEAAKADGMFISRYAKRYKKREDVAETINWWIAVRCKPNSISKSDVKKIIEGIPNRLKYLDQQNFDTHPLKCNY